jgi:hypothetical protein
LSLCNTLAACDQPHPRLRLQAFMPSTRSYYQVPNVTSGRIRETRTKEYAGNVSLPCHLAVMNFSFRASILLPSAD